MRSTFILLLFLGSAAAGCVLPDGDARVFIHDTVGEGEAVEAPQWSAGDAWVYRGTHGPGHLGDPEPLFSFAVTAENVTCGDRLCYATTGFAYQDREYRMMGGHRGDRAGAA